MRNLALLLVSVLLVGCATRQPVLPQTEQESPMFRPTAMRLHPVFTQVKDWTGEGKSDGIEAMLEFQDQFGDPAKSAGQVVFEVFEYRKGSPDPRGARLVNPWIASNDNAAAQREHWNRTGRAYSFQLAWPQISDKTTYVLTATFELTGGGRFTDRIILESARKEPTEQPTTSPARQPGIRMPQP